MSPKCSNIGRRSVSFKWCGIWPTNSLTAPLGICDAMVVEVVVLPLAESIDDNDTIDDDNDMVAGVIVADVPMIISFDCLPFVVLFTESWFCPEPNELFRLWIAVIPLLLLDCGSINRDDFIVWLADSIGDNVINIIIIIPFFRLRTDWALLDFYSTFLFFVSLLVYVDYSALIAMITSINFNIEISFCFCCIFTRSFPIPFLRFVFSFDCAIRVELPVIHCVCSFCPFIY